MLHGIRQQVIYHLTHLFPVKPQFYFILRLVKLQMYLLAFGIRLEKQISLIQEIDQVHSTHLQFHLSLFLFPEVQQLTYQFL